MVLEICAGIANCFRCCHPTPEEEPKLRFLWCVSNACCFQWCIFKGNDMWKIVALAPTNIVSEPCLMWSHVVTVVTAHPRSASCQGLCIKSGVSGIGSWRGDGAKKMLGNCWELLGTAGTLVAHVRPKFWMIKCWPSWVDQLFFGVYKPWVANGLSEKTGDSPPNFNQSSKGDHHVPCYTVIDLEGFPFGGKP